MMTVAFVDKLTAQSRCPICGGDRLLYDRSPDYVERPIAIARFECGAHFFADIRAIVLSSPCRAGSRLAVRMMNAEVERKAL